MSLSGVNCLLGLRGFYTSMKLDIEYATPMTKKECEDFYNSLYASYSYKKVESQRLINENKGVLLLAYDEFEKECLAKITDELIELEIRKKCFETKTCRCGKTLVYRKSHGFYGCNDYKLPGKHDNFNDTLNLHNPYKIFDYWVGCIISDKGFKDKIIPTDLFDFYMNEGLKCLSLKYYGKPYVSKLKTYQKAKGKSKQYENSCELILKSKFDKVFPQFGIKYKLKSEYEKKCFLDFLVSDNENGDYLRMQVNREIDKDENQKNLYLNLIEFISKSKGDKRILTHEYLIES